MPRVSRSGEITLDTTFFTRTRTHTHTYTHTHIHTYTPIQTHKNSLTLNVLTHTHNTHSVPGGRSCCSEPAAASGNHTRTARVHSRRCTIWRFGPEFLCQLLTAHSSRAPRCCARANGVEAQRRGFVRTTRSTSQPAVLQPAVLSHAAAVREQRHPRGCCFFATHTNDCWRAICGVQRDLPPLQRCVHIWCVRVCVCVCLCVCVCVCVCVCLIALHASVFSHTQQPPHTLTHALAAAAL